MHKNPSEQRCITQSALLLWQPRSSVTYTERTDCLQQRIPLLTSASPIAPKCTPPFSLPKRIPPSSLGQRIHPRSSDQMGMHLRHKYFPRLLISVALELRSNASLHGLSLATMSPRKNTAPSSKQTAALWLNGGAEIGDRGPRASFQIPLLLQKSRVPACASSPCVLLVPTCIADAAADMRMASAITSSGGCRPADPPGRARRRGRTAAAPRPAL